MDSVTSIEATDTEAAWSTIVGQADAVAQLQAWSHDPVHAYLFVGPSGTGKRQAARAFSAAVQAQLHPGSLEDRARQLRLALEDKHPDVEIHEPAGASMLVAQAREAIIPSAFRKPLDGPRRILVIDRFHDATDQAAAALLKTVEEPPPNAILILLAESVPQWHIPIASRCARIEFPPIRDHELAEWLGAQGVAKDQVPTLIEAAAGDLRRLQLLIDDEGFADRAQLWQSLPSTLDGTGATAGRLARELAALISDASEPLSRRHAGELAELDAREEALGTRGSGRSQVDARHKRELRKLRTEELRFGLRVLARRYGRSVANGGGARHVAALDRLRSANDALIRNPSEHLLLHDLFWNLPTLSE